MQQHTDIRLSLPSKGRMVQAATDLLAACGLEISKPNPRQYAASIPALPGLMLAFLSVKPSLGAMLIPTFGQQVLPAVYLQKTFPFQHNASYINLGIDV